MACSSYTKTSICSTSESNSEGRGRISSTGSCGLDERCCHDAIGRHHCPSIPSQETCAHLGVAHATTDQAAVQYIKKASLQNKSVLATFLDSRKNNKITKEPKNVLVLVFCTIFRAVRSGQQLDSQTRSRLLCSLSPGQRRAERWHNNHRKRKWEREK